MDTSAPVSILNISDELPRLRVTFHTEIVVNTVHGPDEVVKVHGTAIVFLKDLLNVFNTTDQGKMFDFGTGLPSHWTRIRCRGPMNVSTLVALWL